MFTEIGSPPEAIVTRWGTWIASSAEYYAEKIVHVKEIANSFSANDILVQKAKEAVNNETVLASLPKIKRDYCVLTTVIKKMESSKYNICEAHSDINKLDFKEDSASVMPYIAKRRNNKNSDVSGIMELSRPAVNPGVYAALQQCQSTSASVERSFSMLNKLLAKDRNFLLNNNGKNLVFSSQFNTVVHISNLNFKKIFRKNILLRLTFVNFGLGRLLLTLKYFRSTFVVLQSVSSLQHLFEGNVYD